VSVAEVKKWNHLRTSKLVRGTRLTIYLGGALPPVAGPAKSAERIPAAGPVKATQGETVAAEAKVEAKAETKTEARPEARTEAKAIVHRVQPGETLWSIAKAYKTTVEALRSGNQFLFSRPLQAGDTLMILPPR